MSGVGYLGIAYLVTWLVISAYLFSLARRQKALERRIDEQEKNDPKS